MIRSVFRHFTVALVLIAISLVIVDVFFYVVGSTTDAIVSYRIEHDRCLKNATNGYEIKQCR